jgi:hypothetical protein
VNIEKYPLLHAGLSRRTAMTISGQVEIQSQETGIGGGRQFASMCRTTIVRTAPAVNVITATISIARFA